MYPTHHSRHSLLALLCWLLFSSVVAFAQSKTISGRLAVNDTRLYYEAAGKGETVVLIHGFALDNRQWDSQWSKLNKRYRVIRYDVRGFGQSARARDPHDPTDDLKALLDSLGITQTHLVGAGMGANIALHFAARYPQRVLKIVAANTELDGFEEYTPELSASLHKAVGIISQQGWHDEQQEFWLRSPFTRLYAAEDRAVIRLSEMTADYHGDHLINPRINPYFGPPHTLELLPLIQVQTLILTGSKEEETFHRMAKVMAERIPNSSTFVIKNSGHLSNLEKSTIFTSTLLHFLKNGIRQTP